MKKLIIALSLLLIILPLSAQDFFRETYNSEKDYVILVNPTAGNIEVIRFLTDKGLFRVDLRQVEFVGVYHSGQSYDFSRSASHISTNSLSAFHLHEVREPLSDEDVYRENACSDELRMIFNASVGVIFFGGPDIQPVLYDEENLYSETDDPMRHTFEVTYLFHLLGSTRNPSFVPLLRENPGYVVTGFCLGMQTMNVAAGGALYQDIPAQIYNSHTPESTVKIGSNNLHRNYWQEIERGAGLMGSNLHTIRFTDDPFFGSTVKVARRHMPLIYSSHHQSVSTLAPSFRVTALSDDGKVIEGIAHNRYPHVFAVQFHPEVSALYEARSEVRFTPQDTPATLHALLDKKSLKFHRSYWKYISKVISSQLTKR